MRSGHAFRCAFTRSNVASRRSRSATSAEMSASASSNALHDLSHQRPIFSRPGVGPLSPPRVALFHISSRPAAIFRWSQPTPAGANRTQPAFPRENLLQANIMHPEIVEIVFVQKTLTTAGNRSRPGKPSWGRREPDAALMSDPVVLAMNMEAIEMRIAPAHGDLNGVMEIGDRLIAAQQNAAPDHRAHAPQNHLELVDANLTRIRPSEIHCIPGPLGPASILRFRPEFYALQKLLPMFCRKLRRQDNVLDFVAAMEKCSVRDAALKLQNWFSLAGGPGGKPKIPPADSELAREKRVGEQTSAAEEGTATGPNKPLGFELRGIDHGHEYLTGRGITKETAEHFGVGLFSGKGSMSGRVVHPDPQQGGGTGGLCWSLDRRQRAAV